MKEKYMKKLWILFGLLSIFIGGKTLLHTITYELGHTFTADTPLYWTVGRGILNGISPYSGLYENKPVGIFLMSAASFALTNDTILCNVFSIIALVVIGMLPIVWVYETYKKRNQKSLLRFIGAGSFALLSGLLLMLYCEVRSGAFQVEAIGAAFIGLYFWAALHIKCDSLKSIKKLSQVFWILLAALFVMCGTMMKEPFAVMAVISGLLFVENVKDFIGRIVLPLGIGGIIAVILLAINGLLSPYLNIYIKNMFGNHITAKGSPIVRGFQLHYIWKDMIGVSDILLAVVVILIVLFMIPFRKNSKNTNIYHIVRMVLAVYVASFCVGLGGQYYNHHFIFAAPLYLLLIMLGAQKVYEFHWMISKQMTTVGLAALIVIVFANSNLAFAGSYTDKYHSIKAKAEYVDNMLDYYGEDTYQYLGFNGESCFYGLTKHSPLGPVFAQDPDNFQTADSWFSEKLLEQLNIANIVIVSYLNMPAIDTQVQAYLDANFTTAPLNAYSEEEMPEDFAYQIYYRSTIYG